MDVLTAQQDGTTEMPDDKLLDRAAIRQCVNDLEIIAKSGAPEEATNQVVYLPL